MRFLGRLLFRLILLALLVGGIAYYLAGRAEGPAVEVLAPESAIGIENRFDVAVEAPRGELSRLTVELEQNGQRFPLFSLENPGEAEVQQESENRMRVSGAFGRRSLPALNTGEARLIVEAHRPVLYGLREASTAVARDLQVLLEPPRVTVLSRHHFVNHGGSEMVVYRVTPADAESGVAVGDKTYPGYPAAGAGVRTADASMKVAFFALLYEQDLRTPIEVFGRDAAGNTTRVPLDHQIFPRQFRRSRITIDDDFMRRVVPAIVANSPEVRDTPTDPENLLQAYLVVNGELRQMNAETIAAHARQTAPIKLWDGAFAQLTNSQVESAFADHRTYVYEGREVDQQVHLGFDLAVTANVPVQAANHGTVLFADFLGIYGNCVILDHGQGVQSLYAHLSSFDVAQGDSVQKGQTIGRSGMTGLAGGDHLHFTMLVNGNPVNPVEWWDPHWIQDRITRKLEEAAPAS